MNTLIPIIQRDGELVADSREIAAGLNIQHDSLIVTIETHRATLEAEFGILRFEIGKLLEGAGRLPRFAYLTENQALFVATL